MEILYYTKNAVCKQEPSLDIRWLTVDDCQLFCEHLTLCGQRLLTKEMWDRIYAEGTRYCGLFVGDKMVSRACVETYSANAWEVADVRTVKEYRGNGYAFRVSSFVLNYILSQGRTATIRTEEDNLGMQKVISRLGFTIL